MEFMHSGGPRLQRHGPHILRPHIHRSADQRHGQRRIRFAERHHWFRGLPAPVNDANGSIEINKEQ